MTADSSSNQNTVTTSKLYMLRCLIAMAHADGILCDEEHAYISALMNRMPLSEEQRKTLEEDLDNAKSVSELLPHISEPSFKGQLVYFARLMSYKDGNLHPNEEELLQKLHSYSTDGLDMDEIRASAQSAAEKEIALHDMKMENKKLKKGSHVVPWFQWLDEVLLSVGIDLSK